MRPISKMRSGPQMRQWIKSDAIHGWLATVSRNQATRRRTILQPTGPIWLLLCLGTVKDIKVQSSRGWNFHVFDQSGSHLQRSPQSRLRPPLPLRPLLHLLPRPCHQAQHLRQRQRRRPLPRPLGPVRLFPCFPNCSGLIVVTDSEQDYYFHCACIALLHYALHRYVSLPTTTVFMFLQKILQTNLFSFFPPPGGTTAEGISGNLLGLCSYSCDFDHCLDSACVCTRFAAAAVPAPAQLAGKHGCPADNQKPTNSDYAYYVDLCEFICSRGYCPEGACKYC